MWRSLRGDDEVVRVARSFRLFCIWLGVDQLQGCRIDLASSAAATQHHVTAIDFTTRNRAGSGEYVHDARRQGELASGTSLLRRIGCSSQPVREARECD